MLAPMPDRIEKLQQLLEADPEDSFCLYALAQEFASRGEHDRALEYYERTLAMDAGMLYAYFHKARSQEELGDIDAARGTLRDGLARAEVLSDLHAAAEISGYLDSLDG
jgi:tetratricopeptide (TPR) repeat protein